MSSVKRRSLEDLRETIVRQAGDDWLEFEVSPEVAPSGTLRVPRAPFVCWALKPRYQHLWPSWKVVSPVGLKLNFKSWDDPHHTDWLIGAGFDPIKWYDPDAKPGTPVYLLAFAADDELWRIQCEMLKFRCAVLSGNGKSKGRPWHADQHPGKLPPPDAILVLPDLSMRWFDQAKAAATHRTAIVTEHGGATAHLVANCLEDGVRIVRIPDARRLYPDSSVTLTVDCETGRINLELP